MKKVLLSMVIGLSPISLTKAQSINVFNFGFDTAITAPWVTTNQSAPVGQSTWTKAPYTLPLANVTFGSGNTTTLPVGQVGGANSFALVNFNSTTGAGTISNWLISPAIQVQDGDIVSFYTRKGTDGTLDYADRLELRYSTAATTTNPSTGATAVGSFTNIGVTVNPNLASGFVYPKTWTKYQFTVTGVGTTAVPVTFAFRYYVTDGGPSGTNSDLIGLDTFSVDRNTLSTNEVNLKQKSFSITPNPTSDFLNIKSDSKISAISVVDLSGRKMEATLNDNKVDVRNIPKGTYIINIETKEGKTSEKFIKQ